MTRQTTAALALVALIGCDDLAPIEPDVCGNDVVELVEDCDGAIDPDLAAEGAELACGPAGGDADQACRYICVDADCPIGTRCGGDGVCRAPSGQFEPRTELFFAASELALRDMDRDGVLDLTGTTGTRISVAFGDGSGEFSEIASVGTPAQLPASFADAQVVAPLVNFAPAIHAVQSSEDRQLEPVMSGSRTAIEVSDDALAVRVDAHGVSPPSQVLVLDRDGDTLRLDQLLRNDEQTAAAVPFELVEPGGFLRPEVAELDGAIDGTTEELTLARRGGDQVRILTIADVTGAPRPEVVTTVSVTGLGLIADPPIVADATGDGNLDLLIPVNDSGLPCFLGFDDPDSLCRIAVAPATGPSSFDPPAFDARFDPALASGDRPLAAADLDGDGDDDFVIGGDVFAAGPAELVRTDGLEGGFGPAAVEVADVNRDGLADLVALPSVGNEVEVLVNAGGGLFNSVLLEVPGNPAELAVGDFDGDRVDDIAALAGLEDGSAIMAISFGAASGQLGAFQVMTRQPRLTSLIAAQNTSVSRIEDLVFFGSDGVRPPLLIAAAGTSSRQMVETRTLHSLDGSELFRAQQVLADDFDGDGVSDIVALTEVGFLTCDQTFWLAPGRGNGSYQFPVREDALEVAIDAAAPPGELTKYTTGDLDADGRADIIGVTADDCAQGQGLDLVVVHGAESAAFAALPDQQGPLGTPRSVEVADLDRDGFDDLIVSTFEDTAEIIFNDPGQLGIRALGTRVSLQFDPAEPFQPIAALDADDDDALELVTLGGERVLLADLDGDRRLGPPDLLIPIPVPGARDIHTGDLDNDGVDDIAVSTGTRVVIFLGVPKETIRAP